MAVTTARKELVAVGVRFAEAVDVVVKNRSLRAVSLEKVSGLDLEVDAQAVADEVLVLRKGRRDVVRFSAVGEQFKRKIGETIDVDFGDFNPTSALFRGIILNLSEDTGRQDTQFLVWGN